MDYEGRDAERDFSVVAWGRKGEDDSLRITHNDDVPRAVFPSLV